MSLSTTTTATVCTEATTTLKVDTSGKKQYFNEDFLLFQLRQVPSGGKASLINHGSRSSSTSRRSSRASSSKSVSKAPSATSYTAQEISDYESRIAFIQRQHEKMLFALHTEVEDLKRKNKGTYFYSCEENALL